MSPSPFNFQLVLPPCCPACPDSVVSFPQCVQVLGFPLSLSDRRISCLRSCTCPKSVSHASCFPASVFPVCSPRSFSIKQSDYFENTISAVFEGSQNQHRLSVCFQMYIFRSSAIFRIRGYQICVCRLKIVAGGFKEGRDRGMNCSECYFNSI